MLKCVFATLSACICKKSMCFCLVSMLVAASALPSLAGSKGKDEDTLNNATNVLQQMLADQSIPADLIAKAECIIVLPDVKKFAFGIGGSGGRGPMVCRTSSTGRWSAPAMYSVGGMSAGLQIGGSSSDFVLLVMSKKGENALLNGKATLGRDATAAAGPSGASASSVLGNDILTYKRSQGMFAGVSLSGASLEPDSDANQRIYGKPLTPQQIIQENEAQPSPAGQALMSLLNSK